MEPFLEQVSADLYDTYGSEISKLCLVFPSRRARLFFAEALSKRITQPVWQPQALSISDLVFQWAGRRPSDSLQLLAELYKVYQGLNASDTPPNTMDGGQGADSWVKQADRSMEFDTFFLRGEMLLHDFDQIDKYLVKPKMLFQNLRDQKMLEGDYTFLTPEQIAAVQQFWSSFRPEKSDLQESFTRMWAQMYPLYSQFREALAEKGLAYEGMLYRQVAEEEAEALLTPDPAILSYIFIGFNALNSCERTIFKRLQALGIARFYWDYDPYYVGDERQEAGMFLRKNLKEFPPPPPSMHAPVDIQSALHSIPPKFSLPKQIESWAVPSGVVQAKLVPQIIQTNHLHTDKRTAVVLCDESLLIPLLSALPMLDAEINVTMGYPLAKTSLFSFTEALLMFYRSARRRGDAWSYYHTEVFRLLSHPFISYLCPNAAKVLKEKIVNENILFVHSESFESNQWLRRLSYYPSEPDSWLALFTEVLEAVEETAQQAVKDATQSGEKDLTLCAVPPDPLLLPIVRLAVMEVNKFRNTLKTCEIEITMPLVFSLLRKTLKGVSVPFSGEPLQGIQVMGFLETRALDFEHIVLLSAQEGFLPSASETPSFIPYNLKAGFGLPLQEEREAMYAYYFYRLIQRAQKVSLLYSVESDGIQTGEKSRYLLQLIAESPHDILEKRLSLPVVFPTTAPKIEIAKSGLHRERLTQYAHPETGRPLSPSAVKAYLQCPLRFCFQYIEQIKEEREVDEDVDGRRMGTILHSAMESLYRPFLGKSITARTLDRLLEEKRLIRSIVENVIHNEYASEKSAIHLFEQGRWLILADVMTEYVTQVVRYDKTQTPFTLKALEVPAKTLIYLTLAPPSLADTPFAHTPIADTSPATEEKTPFSSGFTNTIPLGGIIDRLDERDGINYVLDYKTGKNQRAFESLEALFAPEQRHQNGDVFQIFWYAMLQHDMEPQKRVIPLLYYMRTLFDPEASPRLSDKSAKREIEDITPYLATFRTLLEEKLTELFDLSKPFSQTPDPSHCTYCAYNTICRRTT